VLAKELAYYRAHFREAVQKDGVICLECGAFFKFLPGHRQREIVEQVKSELGFIAQHRRVLV
jgi:predicted transcriptional regulator